jgi:hypothetical protein
MGQKIDFLKQIKHDKNIFRYKARAKTSNFAPIFRLNLFFSNRFHIMADVDIEVQICN